MTDALVSPPVRCLAALLLVVGLAAGLYGIRAGLDYLTRHTDLT
jgi:hypothetical protein